MKNKTAKFYANSIVEKVSDFSKLFEKMEAEVESVKREREKGFPVFKKLETIPSFSPTPLNDGMSVDEKIKILEGTGADYKEWNKNAQEIRARNLEAVNANQEAMKAVATLFESFGVPSVYARLRVGSSGKVKKPEKALYREELENWFPATDNYSNVKYNADTRTASRKKLLEQLKRERDEAKNIEINRDSKIELIARLVAIYGYIGLPYNSTPFEALQRMFSMFPELEGCINDGRLHPDVPSSAIEDANFLQSVIDNNLLQ